MMIVITPYLTEHKHEGSLALGRMMIDWESLGLTLGC